MDTDKVLVLNNSFEPLHVCTARRAVILLFTGRAERVEDSLRIIRSPSIVWVLPAVIRLHRYVKRPVSPAISFNKKNILKRDAYTCQYCGRNGGERMTIDHIIPKSLGGRTVWENVVSAPGGQDGPAPEAFETGLGLLPRHHGAFAPPCHVLEQVPSK
jgi:5-methylcytosine-specific restriction endonuclease McrA